MQGDQSILNVAFNGSWYKLPTSIKQDFHWSGQEKIEALKSTAAVVHLHGQKKPPNKAVRGMEYNTQ